MTDLTKRLSGLHASLHAKRGLDWPLTSRGQDAVLILARKTLNDAQAYLLVGQEDAAALSMQVTEDSLRVRDSLHALATEEI